MDEELRAKIMGHYQLGQGSIQDIARVYRLEVADVLEVIGQQELLEIESVGDMVDAKDLQPGTEIIPSTVHRAHFTTN